MFINVHILHYGDYAKQHQMVQQLLADMAIGVELSRLSYLRAAWETDQKRRATYYASISKAYSCDIANKIVSDAVQVPQRS